MAKQDKLRKITTMLNPEENMLTPEEQAYCQKYGITKDVLLGKNSMVVDAKDEDEPLHDAMGDVFDKKYPGHGIFYLYLDVLPTKGGAK